uniref:Uncharacterized protein n=1 Tax=Glossina austeni TaxID=7395 RepID=A0A1A9UGM8_GLOAU
MLTTCSKRKGYKSLKVFTETVKYFKFTYDYDFSFTVDCNLLDYFIAAIIINFIITFLIFMLKIISNTLERTLSTIRTAFHGVLSGQSEAYLPCKAVHKGEFAICTLGLSQSYGMITIDGQSATIIDRSDMLEKQPRLNDSAGIECTRYRQFLKAK